MSDALELIDQPFYDRVPVPIGPVETLRFFDRPVGQWECLVGDHHAKGYADTNDQIGGGILCFADREFSAWGLAHQLVVGNRLEARRVRQWWDEHARSGHLELQIVSKCYLRLPLAALPLLKTFQSPNALEERETHRWDEAAKQFRLETTRLRHLTMWRLETPLLIRSYQYFQLRLIFSGAPVTNPYRFDVRLYLYGSLQRRAA